MHSKNDRAVLIVSTAKTFGGGERYVLNVASVYHACGVRVGLIASCPELVAKARNGTGCVIAEVAYCPRMFAAARKVVALLSENNYLVVHLNGHRDIVFAPLIRAARRKVIAVRHTEVYREPSVRARIKVFLYKLFAPFANELVCVSNAVRCQTVTHIRGMSDIRLIENWVDAGEIKIERKYTEKPLYHILIVARIDRLKGHTVLFEACRDMDNVVVDVVGDGPELANLRALNYPNVVFHGFQEDVASFYDDADIFVLPSFSEGSPMVLLEAMARGLPCITSDIPSLAETIEHNVTGILFEKGNANSLRQAISVIIGDSATAERIGRNARDYVISRRSAEAAGVRYRALLKELGL